MMFLAQLLFSDIGKNIGRREMLFRLGVSTLSVLFAFYHVFFMVCFAAYGIYMMLPVNLVSAILYVIIVLVNRRRMSGALGVVFALIPPVYAAACVYMLGWDFGAQWCLFVLIVPVYLIYEKFSGSLRWLCVSVMLLMTISLYYIASWGNTVYGEADLTAMALNVMAVSNIFFSGLAGIMAAEVLNFSSLFNRRRYQNKLTKLMDETGRDTLTNMFNRKYMENMLTNIFWDEAADRDRVFVATIDIDRFKDINDEYGQEAGDGVLKKFANVMLDGFRGTDVTARWGGEVFLVVLNDTDEKGALKAFENFKDKLRQAEIEIDGRRLDLKVTIGFVSCSGDDNYMECIKRSNEALTYGKNNGRDMIVNYKDI